MPKGKFDKHILRDREQNAKNLKMLRKRIDLTQEQMWRRLESSLDSYGKYERNIHPVTRELQLKILIEFNEDIFDDTKPTKYGFKVKPDIDHLICVDRSITLRRVLLLLRTRVQNDFTAYIKYLDKKLPRYRRIISKNRNFLFNVVNGNCLIKISALNFGFADALAIGVSDWELFISVGLFVTLMPIQIFAGVRFLSWRRTLV